MSLLKTIGTGALVGLAFGAGMWMAKGKQENPRPETAPVAAKEERPAPAAANAPAAKLPPPPSLPASGNLLADAFGKQVPALPAGEVPVPEALRSQKGLLSRAQMEKAREQMNQMGPDALKFLRDELRLSDRDIQQVADTQREMDASLAAFAEQARGRDLASMNGQMKEMFTAYTEKLEATIGRENTMKLHQFRAGQFRKVAEQSGMPAPPSL